MDPTTLALLGVAVLGLAAVPAFWLNLRRLNPRPPKERRGRQHEQAVASGKVTGTAPVRTRREPLS